MNEAIDLLRQALLVYADARRTASRKHRQRLNVEARDAVGVRLRPMEAETMILMGGEPTAPHSLRT